MFTNTWSSFRHPRLSKRRNLRVRRLNRRRVLKEEAKKNKRVRAVKMEMKNLKLFRVNRSIIEENEKLRQKALLLHQENQALLFQLQTKISQQQKQQQQSLI
ncbi:hypothetical protein ACB098_06G195000 [Castanea mollissima]|uniref:Uncharacterized protein n=1 Tax=Castanea mollissima TaxID=60419 RepID=A0A8J4RRQ2_9ROSI|nr:hypothetical protein CMV_003712 [Castanea mollissima]